MIALRALLIAWVSGLVAGRGLALSAAGSSENAIYLVASLVVFLFAIANLQGRRRREPAHRGEQR